MKKTTLITGLALIASAVLVMAQDAAPRRPGPGPGGPGGPGGPMRGGPVLEALDANHDGEIDAAEIANASAALKTLDKNSDGKLSVDEIRPQRPVPREGGPGAPGGPDGPRGPGGPNRRAPGN